MARGDITVKVSGQYDDKDINRAIKDLNALKAQAAGTAGGMSGLTNSLKGLAAIAGVGLAIGAVTDFMKDSMAAAIEDEKSMVALATAMTNVGVGAQNAQVEGFVRSLSLATGVVDDELRPSLQRLITAVGDVAEAEGLLQTAMNISAAGYGDLETVSKALSKASLGNIGALTRLGVPLDANIVKTKDFGAAVDVLNTKFAGQSAAAASTYGGSLLRIQTAASEASETIGYALLGTLDDLSASIGGTGGVVEMITAVGDSIAGMVTDIGSGVTALVGMGSAVADFVNGVGSLVGVNDLAGNSFSALGGFIRMNLLGPLGLIGDLYQSGAEDAKAATAATDGMKYTLVGTDAILDAYAASMADAAAETLTAKQQADAFKAAVKGINDAISGSQSLDDYKEMLRGIGEELKGNVRSMDGWGTGAKENRDKIRTAFSDMTSIVQGWVDTGKISADDFQSTWDGKAKGIVDRFVKAGFKRSDIETWLGSQNIWTSPAVAKVTAMRDKIAAVAPTLLTSAGAQMAAGLAQGLANSGAIDKAVIAVTQGAINKANQILEINSPSKVFARMGASIGEELSDGMEGSEGKVNAAAGKMISGIVKAWQQKAADDIAAWKSSAQSSLASIFDIGTAYEAAIGEDGALSVQKWVEGAQAQAAQIATFGNILTSIKAAGGSQELLDYLLSKGAETGGAMGQAMITNGLIPTFNGLLGTVQTTVTTAANSLVPTFLTTGVASGQATVDGITSHLGPGGAGRASLGSLMSDLANSMRRDTTITVTTIRREISVAAAGLMGLAAGGPVSSFTPYIVGEQGPELFVPSTSGTIIPNGRSGGGGGTTYQITVQAGVGDPRAIGQQVVEYVKRFEQANGKVWAAA